MRLAYGVCVGSWEKFQRNVEMRANGWPVFALAGQTSISTAYNTILDACRGHDLDAVILQHDDLEITDVDAEVKFLDALALPATAIVGVAGGYNVTSLAWWEADTVGHQLTDDGPLEFGDHAGQVQSLEGSVMAFSPWAIEHLRFDTTFIGFHGYDDIGMTALALGKQVRVADVDTYHHVNLGFKSPESATAWELANAQFCAKWRLS